MTDAQERIGQSIGDYHLQRLLGQGTFGIVYLAEHLQDHTSAVVKLLRNPLTGHDALHAFLNEARTMRLRHPHIVPLIDFGLSRPDNLPYLVMAYADGGTLRDRYPKGSRLPHETIDSYVQQLASALQYAHDHHVIHRDVKPQNMLVCSDGTIQLSDFGIAKISEHGSQSSLYKMVGTPAYAAPEQSQGKPCPASDQYALATLVYEWLAGRLPFQGDSFAVALQHRTDAPPSLRSICPEVSPQLEQVIFKALAKAPGDRFPTITHFAQALHTVLQEEMIPTEPLPHLDLSHNFSSTIMPVSSSEDSRPQTVPSQAPLAPADVPHSPPLVIASLQSAEIPEPVELSLSSTPTRNLAKQHSTGYLNIALIVLLSLVLLLGGGGGAWLVMMQQQKQAHANDSATATAIAAPLATATAASQASAKTAANAYWAGVASHGVQLGFDAAHTSWNPYEQILNTANVSQITRLWSFTLGGGIELSSVAVANRMVYVGSRDHKFYAFDANCRHACQPLWSFTTGDQILSSPAVANGMVYIGSLDHRLYVFDANCRQNCQPLWSFTAGDGIEASPAVANGMVYIGSLDHRLYAFDANCRQNCQPLWSFQTGNWIGSSPAVTNGMVYVSSIDSNLYAFDASCRQNCQPLWSFQTVANIVASPVVTNGMVYVGSLGQLYAFDATCRRGCQPLWSFTTGNGILSSPAVANGVVYVDGDGQLYAFDENCRQSCQPLWSFIPAGNTITNSPSVANGVVYVGSGNGQLYTFDANCRQSCQPLPTGNTISSLPVIPTQILSTLSSGFGKTSPPVVANGVVYIGSNDGTLSAIGLPASS